MIIKRHFAQSLPVVAALLLCACASAPKEASDPISAADDAVLNAEDARAADYAAPEMRSARDKLEQARLLQKQKSPDGKDDGSQRRARWLAEEAIADAHLAEAKATNVRTRAVIEQMQAGPLPPLGAPPPPMAPPVNPAAPREPVLPPRAIPSPVVPGATAIPAGQPDAAPSHGVPAPVVPGASAIPSDPDAPPPPDAVPPASMPPADPAATAPGNGG